MPIYYVYSKIVNKLNTYDLFQNEARTFEVFFEHFEVFPTQYLSKLQE